MTKLRTEYEELSYFHKETGEHIVTLNQACGNLISDRRYRQGMFFHVGEQLIFKMDAYRPRHNAFDGVVYRPTYTAIYGCPHGSRLTARRITFDKLRDEWLYLTDHILVKRDYTAAGIELPLKLKL